MPHGNHSSCRAGPDETEGERLFSDCSKPNLLKTNNNDRNDEYTGRLRILPLSDHRV